MTDRNATEIIREIRDIFDHRGAEWYGGEAVSQVEHALQSAALAEGEAAPPSLIVAALLHDVGHLLHDLPEDVANHGVDDRHESLAAGWLKSRFVRPVVEAVGMHVTAKRYLCAVDPQYLGQLSPASEKSLRLQGGPMSKAEVQQFEQHASFRDAVRLRRWDDAAKVPGAPTPSLEHFLQYVPDTVLGPRP